MVSLRLFKLQYTRVFDTDEDSEQYHSLVPSFTAAFVNCNTTSTIMDIKQFFFFLLSKTVKWRVIPPLHVCRGWPANVNQTAVV